MKWQSHPVLEPPTDEEIVRMDAADLIELHRLYHEAIENAEKDPFRYGFRLPHWKLVEEALKDVDEALILGGNRSSKTYYGADAVVRAAVNNPKSEIFCFAQTSEVSIRQQQSAVWDILPAELKAKQTTSSTYINYSKKNGFTDSSLILPNGSQIIFKTYSQYTNNPSILEGAELGSKNPEWINIGVWLDEYLMGPGLIETMRFRLATRNSKMIITFTPIDGYTEVVKQYLDKAVTIQTRNAALLNNEPVPFVQRSEKPNASIHYFHSDLNVFGGYDRIKRDVEGKSREHILIRAYGVPTKSRATKFPKFNTAINVVSPESIPTSGITRYHIIDPAGSKNWFMVWIAVDGSGTFWVYREWPDIGVGFWAEEGKEGKWMPGDGAKGLGYGIKDYVDLIHEVEGNEEIYERLIDPRLGAAKYQGSDGSSSIIEDLAENDIICLPAPGLEIEDGLQALISKMSWDNSKPLDSVNRPHFYVSSECENIIQALAEYTGEGGLKEAWKDPIDCYDAETEVMSKNGWVKFKDLPKDLEVATMSKDMMLEWQKPEAYIEKDYDGEMIAMQTRALDFVVTPTHRMVVHPQKAGETAIREAKLMFRQDTIPVVTKGLVDSPIPMVEIYPGKWCAEDDWAEFLGWYVSEGCVTGAKGGKIQKSGRGHQVMISQSREANPEKCDKIEALFERMGLNFSRRGSSYFLTRKELWKILAPLGNSYTKRLPKEVFSFSRQSLENLFQAMVDGDGWRKADGKCAYASVSKGLIDDLQIVMQLLGRSHGSIVVRGDIQDSAIRGRKVISTSDQYWLIERVNRASCITNKAKEYLPKPIEYNGKVYCVSVPNETLIVRRNGKVMVCGNCVRYAAIADIDHVDAKSMKVTMTGTGGY